MYKSTAKWACFLRIDKPAREGRLFKSRFRHKTKTGFIPDQQRKTKEQVMPSLNTDSRITPLPPSYDGDQSLKNTVESSETNKLTEFLNGIKKTFGELNIIGKTGS
jgi:hypothetical protein